MKGNNSVSGICDFTLKFPMFEVVTSKSLGSGGLSYED